MYMDEKVKYFLEHRVPFYIEADTLLIKIPISKDRGQDLTHIMTQYGYPWIGATRGYLDKATDPTYLMLYTDDYDVPNVNVAMAQYLFNYFPTIKWIGLGCIKGVPGEYWKPRLVIRRDNSDVIPE